MATAPAPSSSRASISRASGVRIQRGSGMVGSVILHRRQRYLRTLPQEDGMQIAGSTTVITGGASGLGRATAERLHGGGGAVVLLDLAKSPGAQVAAALGERALFAPADVTNPDEVVAALEAAVARFGAVHALVNCAGIGTADKTFGKRGPADLGGFARTIQVNLIGTFNCIRLAAAQSEEHTSELQSRSDLVCRLLLEKKKKKNFIIKTMIKTKQKKQIKKIQ